MNDELRTILFVHRYSLKIIPKNIGFLLESKYAGNKLGLGRNRTLTVNINDDTNESFEFAFKQMLSMIEQFHL